MLIRPPLLSISNNATFCKQVYPLEEASRAVFCVDTMAPPALEKFQEARRSLPRKSPVLYALDLGSDKPKWEFEPGVEVIAR